MLKYTIPLLFCLCGCATSSVVVGTVRPAISPASVKLYLKEPKKYEQIAILESSSKSSFAFSDQGKMDAVMANLKEEAARLGANGVLLQSSGNSNAQGMVMMPVGAGFMGVPYDAGHKAGSGLAIHVIEE